ncbi:hypothetical protein G7Y89_g1010 [Cudoniella acicularis]|uniref:Uncharacterized protein n=1 Tax=Cudoniella acicularis TaxID=354080 RepID=A0A8H4RYX5_9HELO|nr:hypothetical protein G7Y89_g1010 [Cudoniella acicularis]
MAALPSVSLRTSIPEVQECMNRSVEMDLWNAKSPRWRYLLVIRKQFIKEQLQKEGITPTELKNLDVAQRRYRLLQLEQVFAAEFFQYTRDNGWMEDAVGPNSNWLYIHGMSAWHVRHTVQAIEATLDDDGDDATGSPSTSQPSQPSQPAV